MAADCRICRHFVYVSVTNKEGSWPLHSALCSREGIAMQIKINNKLIVRVLCGRRDGPPYSGKRLGENRLQPPSHGWSVPMYGLSRWGDCAIEGPPHEWWVAGLWGCHSKSQTANTGYVQVRSGRRKRVRCSHWTSVHNNNPDDVQLREGGQEKARGEYESWCLLANLSGGLGPHGRRCYGMLL